MLAMKAETPPRNGPLPLLANTHPGVLVTMCGIDGAGKSTAISAVQQHLQARGLSTFHTYTPTPRIRRNPLFRELIDASTPEARARVDVAGLCLQIMGDLLQHLSDTIVPRLKEGHVVLCDRYVYTSLGEIRARSWDVEVDALLARISRRVIRPDLAIALDVSPQVAMRRVFARPEEADKPLDAAFVAAQAASYRRVAEENGLLIVSGEQSQDRMMDQILPALDRCLAMRVL